MSNPARRQVIVGNWKMYKTIEETIAFIKQLTPLVESSVADVFLAVPFTSIKSASEQAKDTKITIGGQNMNDASQGAFTGEIAGKMLKNAGAQFVILGHSERRHLYKETNELINKKVHRALVDQLLVILCIGETSDEREQDKTAEILKNQLEQSLTDVSDEQLGKIIIAYEPVWAIGTGKTATPEVAEKSLQLCRELIAAKWLAETAEKMRLLYGGSVNPDNAKELMGQSNIDGLLVGGASLSVDLFSKIVNYE